MKLHCSSALVCVVLLCFCAAFADNCSKEDGAKITYKNCPTVDVALKMAAESYEMKFDLGGSLPGGYSEEVKFNLGGCAFDGYLSAASEGNASSSDRINIESAILTFPIQVVVGKNSVKLTGKSGTSYSPSPCKVDFAKFEDGFKTTLKVTGEAASKLTTTVTGLFVPPKSILPVWAWVLIALISLIFVSGSASFPTYCFWWKKRTARKVPKPTGVSVNSKKQTPLTASVDPEKTELPVSTVLKKKEVRSKASKDKTEATTIVEHEKTRDRVSIDQLLCIEQSPPKVKKHEKKKKARRAIEEPPTATISESAEPPPKINAPAPFRHDIVELTAVDKQTTNITEDRASIANTVEDDFLNKFPDVPPSYPSGMVAGHVLGHEVLHTLLGLNQAERRFFMYFEDNSEEVYDAVTEVLKNFGSHKQRNIMVGILIKELANIKQIASEVYSFLYFEDKSKANLPYSFKSVEELLGVPIDKLEQAISTEPPTYRQRRWIEVDLTRIKHEIDQRTFQSIESPILVVLDARIKFMREAFGKLAQEEASRPGFYTIEGVPTGED